MRFDFRLLFAGDLTGGATHTDLINAFGGNTLILTEQGGKIYHIQAVDSSGHLFTQSFYSVRGCK